jgi:hypothetical protein
MATGLKRGENVSPTQCVTALLLQMGPILTLFSRKIPWVYLHLGTILYIYNPKNGTP